MGRENHPHDGADVLRTSGGSRRNPASKGSRIEPIRIYQAVSRRPFHGVCCLFMQLGYVLVDVGVGLGRGKMRRKRCTARLSSSILKTPELSASP